MVSLVYFFSCRGEIIKGWLSVCKRGWEVRLLKVAYLKQI